jgi:alkanesulfonate monooxygenase SsuD/methylene tetrahydromethanopterin reductase-like flavin-dependent oxidoreductase (luciferase family)
VKLGIATATSAGATRDSVAAVIASAERLGYDSVWFADHVAVPAYAVGPGGLAGAFLEPMATCAWALGVSRRLHVGTDVLVAGYRHPLLVRAMAATASALGEGRLVLGVGIGYLRGEFEALGARYDDRGAAADAFLQVVRHGVTDLVQVEQPVPLWVGGNHGRALRRAALFGDGWHPLFPDPTTYAASRSRIVDLRGEAGIVRPFTFSYSCGLTRVYERAPSKWPELTRPASRHPDFGYQPPVPVHDDGRPWFVGTVDDVAGDLRQLADAGVDHVILRFRGDDVLTQLEVGNEVARQLARS